MDELLATLRATGDAARARVSAALDASEVLQASDEQVVDALRAAAEVIRSMDAVLVEATGEIVRRSQTLERDLRLTTRMGCHDVSELVQRTTRLAPSTATRVQRASRAVAPRMSLSGDTMPARLPAMRAALADGDVGLDGLLAVSGPLDGVFGRCDATDLGEADRMLAAEARGIGASGAPAACADLLRIQALAWAAALDQDGIEPREDRALRRRGITLGVEHDGLVPIRGGLLPEVAAQFRRICDAVGSPRAGDGDSDGVRFSPEAEALQKNRDDALPNDPRSWAQKQHDAFATALFAAASSQLLPTMGGAAPTLVISIRAEDLARGIGTAFADGTEAPLPLAAARHTACAGVVQRIVLGTGGRIERIGTEERVFNRHQRRAISLRDGGCIIPGCGVPGAWCEIHHVTEHAHGGPTHTDNGVLLCWHHHRYLEKTGWLIRMNRGVPEVQAPRWLDPGGRWRTATRSRTRMLEGVVRRT